MLEQNEKYDWRYRQCPVDSRPEDFGPFSDLITLWQSKRQGRLLPERSDFSVFDFKPWLGRIAITKFESDPFNVRFVLWGTELTTWWGADYTNKSLGELASQPDLIKEAEGKYFLDMQKDPFIGLVEGELEQQYKRHRKLIGVDLPLGAGENTEQVILVHTEIGPDETLEELLPNRPVQFTY